MKKIFIIYSFTAVSVLLVYCCGPKKMTGTPGVSVNQNDGTAEKAAPKSTYDGGLSTVIMNNCVPCHIPSKGGKVKPYDNFANVKADIDEIIRRIELNPTDRGFMPFKKTEKLSAETIAAFKQWRADGLLEK